MRLYARGMRELVVTHGDCDVCPRGTAPALAHTLRHVNDLLCTRQRPAVALRTLACDQWQAQSAASARAPRISPRRRAFLQRLVAPAQVERASDAPERPEALLRAGDLRTAIFPATPFIDPKRCDGCDACVRMCPTGALTQEEVGEEALRYRMDASRCTGCGICVDVCLPKAVSVLHWTTESQHAVDLHAARCPACGVTYHAPNLRPDRYCRVCAITNHHGKLYQRDPT
jgi:ferredoxin